MCIRDSGSSDPAESGRGGTGPAGSPTVGPWAGGGDGANDPGEDFFPSIDGWDGTGGGGGGLGSAGPAVALTGAGGSGIVMIAYPE